MSDFFKSFLLAALACAAPVAHADEPVAGTPWRIAEKVDEINDELSYFIIASGSTVQDGYLSYKPEIVFRLTPVGRTPSNGMSYAGAIYITIETEGLTRGACGMTTRYDKKKATTEEWSTSTDRRAAFSPNWKSELDKLTAASSLAIRYITTLGDIRTATFDVHGLTNALQKVKAKYLATNPPLVKPKKSPPATRKAPKSPAPTQAPQSPSSPSRRRRGNTAATSPR